MHNILLSAIPFLNVGHLKIFLIFVRVSIGTISFRVVLIFFFFSFYRLPNENVNIFEGRDACSSSA